jgi:cell division protein ZapA
MSTKVRVPIYGNTYTIQGDASPDYIESLTKYLNAKMEEVASAIPSATSMQVAVLAALNIADEYFQLRDLQSTATIDIEKRANALISMLEDGIIGDILQKREDRPELYNSHSHQ